jgi:secretion/DNA translocation related TadE-like protein
MTTERGSTTLVSVAMSLALVTLAGLVLGLGQHFLATHRLQGSVDRAALAASDVSWGYNAQEPCVVATHILVAANFKMASCELYPGGARVVGTATVGGFVLTRRAHAGIVNSGQG